MAFALAFLDPRNRHRRGQTEFGSGLSPMMVVTGLLLLVNSIQVLGAHPEGGRVESSFEPTTARIRGDSPLQPTLDRPLLLRVRRGSAYAGGYGDFSGVAKQSTFAALGSYGGFLPRSHSPTAGAISVPNALGAYGQYVPGAHRSPTVLSSGGHGQGGLLFGKI